MQRPIAHQIIASSQRPFRQWSWATVLVAALHVGLIYALIRGLQIGLVHILPQPIVVHVVTQPPPEPVRLPLPPPTEATLPQTDTMPPPIVKIDEPRETIIVKTSDQPTLTPTAPAAASEPARAVPGTHTIPDYPVLSRRLGEQGIVLLRIVVADSGRIDTVSVIRSSGYSRLDEAACEWVTRYWRYTPAIEGGKAIQSITEASVVFNLKNATQAP